MMEAKVTLGLAVSILHAIGVIRGEIISPSQMEAAAGRLLSIIRLCELSSMACFSSTEKKPV